MSTPQAPELPPGAILYQLAVGHYVSRALWLATRLGLADHLAAAPLSAEALAEKTDCHAPSLRRLLRLLASVGVFEEREDGAFATTVVGDALRAGVPGSSRASVLLFGGTQDRWQELEFCVRTGEPGFRREHPDAGPFDEEVWDPEQAAIFDDAMATFAPQTAAVVAAAYDFSPFSKVADVGGGNGALLVGILKANPGLRGLVFDRPQLAEDADAQIQSAGLGERCEFVGGDFFAKLPEGADAYLLKHVIHDWDDERGAAILATCRKAMPAHAKLLLVEGVYPARIERSLQAQAAAQNDVNMLVCTGGRQRSEAEFRELFAAAGFDLTRIVPTLAGVSVIEGVPAPR